jgi:hypothetical protein
MSGKRHVFVIASSALLPHSLTHLLTHVQALGFLRQGPILELVADTVQSRAHNTHSLTQSLTHCKSRGEKRGAHYLPATTLQCRSECVREWCGGQIVSIPSLRIPHSPLTHSLNHTHNTHATEARTAAHPQRPQQALSVTRTPENSDECCRTP